MGIFDFLRRPPEQKESAAYRLHYDGLPQPKWTPRDYKSFADEGYSKNVIAYQAINRVADAVASIEWGAWSGNQEFETHPILDLLARPNPLQGKSEFFRAKIGYLMIAGNGYDERIWAGDRVVEIWTLRPDRMRIIPSETGIPAGYEYKVGQRRVEWECDTITGESDIRHMKLFNPLDDWYGLSPIEAGAYAVDQHNEAMQWMQSLLQNSARPSGALVVGPEKSLTDDQFARLKKEMEGSYQGAKNAGRPMLLEGGLDWKAMGLSPADMSIIESKYASSRDVALAFGVPPMLLGIPGDNTYSNYREARLAFWEDTVLPLTDHVASELNAWLSPAFGGVELRPNYEAIEAIAEKRREMWAMADKSMELTVNEVRELKGYQPLPDPIGGMLMAELTKSAQPDPATPEEKAMRFAYGCG